MNKEEVFNQLFYASSTQFKILLSKKETKDVVLALVGTRTDIDDLGLSNRVSNKLRRAGFNTIYELLTKYPYSLFDRFKNRDLMSNKTFAKELSICVEIYLRDVISVVLFERKTDHFNSNKKENTETDSEIEKMGNQSDDPGNYSLSENEDNTYGFFHDDEKKTVTEQIIKISINQDDSTEDRFFVSDYYGEIVEYLENHNAPIEELGLTTRAYNSLKRAHIDEIKSLISLTVKQIEGFKNLGIKTKDEISDKLEDYINRYSVVIKNISQEPVADAEMAYSTDEEKIHSFDLENKTIDELISFPGYKNMIIEWFEHKGVSIKRSSLSVRSKNVLLRNEINNVGDLLKLSYDDLKDLHNLGNKSLEEIHKFIKLQLKENKGEYCRFIRNGGEIDHKKEDIEKMLLDMYKTADFYGFSFKEFREHIPDCVSDESLKSIISGMLRAGVLEYVDYRCYKIYPKFSEFIKCKNDSSLISDKQYDMLVKRIEGKSLQEIADEMQITRERVRQLTQKTYHTINRAIARNQAFDEDYYKYLFEHYSIDHDAWINQLGCSEQTYSYLKICCEKGKNKDLREALNDNNVTVNLKYRIQKILDKNLVRIGNEKIARTRKDLISFVLKTYCRDDISFDDFVTLYNNVLDKYNIPYDKALYIENKSAKSQTNSISRRQDVLWKQGGIIRYYNMSDYDYTLLLDTLELSQYKNTECSTYMWIKKYPEIMKQYDIRDQYELHIILKAIVDRNVVNDIDFSRQPIIRFGSFDREKEMKDLLAEISPVKTDSLINEIQLRFGYSDTMIRSNCLPMLSEFYDNGVYTSKFKRLSDEQSKVLKSLLTENYYTIDELKALYVQAFPGNSPNDINPLTLKQLGLTVNNRYALQNFSSADQYFRYILGKDDITDVSALKKKYSEAYNTFSAVLNRMLSEYEIFYFERNQIINIRKLNKLGITKDIIRKFCDSVADRVEEGEYFNITYLRLKGFENRLDELGLDDYFYDSILSVDGRFACGQVFGKIILLKTKETQTVLTNDFLMSLIKNKTKIEYGDIVRSLKTLYGMNMEKKYWHKLDKAVEDCGMYFDHTMEKIYKDKSYYYEDIEKEELL